MKVDQLLSRWKDVISVFLSKLCSIRNYFFSDGKKSKCKWILIYHQSGDGTYKEKLRFGNLYLRENTVSQNYRMDCLPLISLRFARIFNWFSKERRQSPTEYQSIYPPSPFINIRIVQLTEDSVTVQFWISPNLKG